MLGSVAGDDRDLLVPRLLNPKASRATSAFQCRSAIQHGVRLCIDQLWDGTSADERYALDLSVDDSTHELIVSVDAPFFGDPPPPSQAACGPVANLYDYEVVELFLFGAGARYLEVELAPSGHYLALAFAGERQRRGDVTIVYDVSALEDQRWVGRARIPPEALPPAASRVNAHAIHGRSPRRWLSAAAAAGSRPDFHRFDAAIELEPGLARKLDRAYKSLESPG
jgi:hypothetical protein